MKYIGLLIGTVLLAGCDGFIDDMLNENAEVFKESYKLSFIESCIKPENSEEKRALCTCIVDSLVANNSSKQLIDQSNVEKYVEEVAVPQCVQGQAPATTQDS